MKKELIREINIKLTFNTLKIQNESYKLILFSDILILYEINNKTEKKNFIFFMLFLKIKEIKNNEIEVEVIYKNKETVTFQFYSKYETNDVKNIIYNQIEQLNLFLLNNGNEK
jgi:hypothetical protein